MTPDQQTAALGVIAAARAILEETGRRYDATGEFALSASVEGALVDALRQYDDRSS